MTNISYRAASSMTNRYGYNGGNEYEDEGELNYSNTFYRKYDAQIGRFTGIDIKAEEFAGLTPYQFGGNNPVMFNDPKGDKLTLPGRPIKGPDGNYHTGWVSEMMWGNLGFFSNEYLGGGGGGGGNNFTNIRGWSSQSILSQMSFGQSFGKNKRGEYGFWSNVQGRNFNDGFKIRGNDGFVALTYENNIELSHKEWKALNYVFPSFSTLWNNFPKDPGGLDGDGNPNHAHPCKELNRGEERYPNQCAIRMSDCLMKSGISLSGLPSKQICSDGYCVAAINMANFITSQIGSPIAGSKNAWTGTEMIKVLTPAEFIASYSNSTGIVYFQWSYDTGGTGHIDLWNKGVTAARGEDYSNNGAVNMRIWFWPLK